MRVLVACEKSNTVRDAFLKRGHDAYSCDIQRADHPNPNFKRHIRGYVTPLLRERWDLVIAHPPCTYLSIGSSCRLIKGAPLEQQPRRDNIIDGALFFMLCLDANADKICVENPIPHRLTNELIPFKYTQIIHPWQYGYSYTKATCLWLKGLPKLKPTNIVEPTGAWVYDSPNGQTANERSKTFQGIADAMAEQWG